MTEAVIALFNGLVAFGWVMLTAYVGLLIVIFSAAYLTVRFGAWWVN